MEEHPGAASFSLSDDWGSGTDVGEHEGPAVEAKLKPFEASIKQYKFGDASTGAELDLGHAQATAKLSSSMKHGVPELGAQTGMEISAVHVEAHSTLRGESDAAHAGVEMKSRAIVDLLAAGASGKATVQFSKENEMSAGFKAEAVLAQATIQSEVVLRIGTNDVGSVGVQVSGTYGASAKANLTVKADEKSLMLSSEAGAAVGGGGKVGVEPSLDRQGLADAVDDGGVLATATGLIGSRDHLAAGLWGEAAGLAFKGAEAASQRGLPGTARAAQFAGSLALANALVDKGLGDGFAKDSERYEAEYRESKGGPGKAE